MAVKDGEFPTIVHKIYYNEQKYADQVFLRQPIAGEWHEYTWQDVLVMARKLVTFFRSLGLKKGDCVAILSKNCAEWYATDIALMIAGLINVPLYATQHKDTINYILTKTSVKLIVIGKLDEWARMESGIPDHVIRVNMPYDKSISADYFWDEILEKNDPCEDNPTPELTDMFSYVFTSGTTGHPKGVMMTYQQVSNSIKNNSEMLFDRYAIKGELTYLSYLPLAHIYERAIELIAIYQHFTVSFAQSIDTFAHDLQKVSPKLFISVPRLYGVFKTKILEKIPQKKLNILLKIPFLSSLIKHKIKKALGLQNAELVITGSAPIAKSRIEWFAKLGITIFQGYGATENFAVVCAETENARKMGSIGKPVPNVSVKLSDDNELLIKSNCNFVGYFDDPELTKQSMTEDGYWKSGDMAKIDEDGFVYILGRMKEAFKTTKGEFIVPNKIEHCFARNENIANLCLVGYGLRQPILLVELSELTQQKTKKIIEKELKELLTTVNSNLANYEKVSHIYVTKDTWGVENDLLTPTLKLKRHALEEKYRDILPTLKEVPERIIWAQ